MAKNISLFIKHYALLSFVFLAQICLISAANLSAQENPNGPTNHATFDFANLTKSKSWLEYLPNFVGSLFEAKPDQSSIGPLSAPGKPAEELAILLDGKTGYVRIPHSATLNLSSRFTIESWVRPLFTGKRLGIAEKGSSFSLNVSPEGLLEFTAGEEPRTPENVVEGKTPLTANEWHHVAIVFDGKLLSVFLDGRLENSEEFVFQPVVHSADLTIGLTNGSSAEKYFFNGLIDELRLSNYGVYTDDFIPERHLFGGGLFGLTAGSWRFTDQGSQDGTGNNNHGSLVGGVTYIPEQQAGDLVGEVNKSSLNEESSQTPQVCTNASPINFDCLDPVTYINDSYPGNRFNDFYGNSMIAHPDCLVGGGPCPGQSLPNNARLIDGTATVVFWFNQPLNMQRFTVIASDTPFGYTVANLAIQQDGVSYSPIPIVSNGFDANGRGNPIYLPINQWYCSGSPCNRITAAMVYNISDPLGLGYDEFHFTGYASPTPNPTPNCASDALTEGNILPPCLPTPTPTPNPNQLPNAPSNVRAIPQERQVEITWNWMPSDERSSPVTHFLVQRSASATGPWITLNPGAPQVHPPDSRAHADYEGGIRIDIEQYYRVLAVNQFGESPSAVVHGAPKSPCAVSKPVPGTASWNGHGWSGEVDFRHGLSVYNVSLNGRLMAAHMGVPSITIPKNPTEYKTLDLFAHELSDGYEIKLQDYNLNLVDTQERALDATYCIADETSRNKWEIKIEYHFRKRNEAQDPCEPSSVLPCAKFYPLVSYIYTSHKYIPPRDGYVAAYQRFHLRENNDVTNTFTLFRDCGGYRVNFPNPNYLCTLFTYPIAKHERVTMETLAPGIRYDFQPPGRAWEGRATWDNFHQTGDDFTPPPGSALLRWAGCYSCIHSHWRWLNFGPLAGYGRPDVLNPSNRVFRAGSWLSGFKYREGTEPYSPSKQHTDFTVVKYKPEEFNRGIPPSISLDAEEIYQSKKMYRNSGGTYITEPGGDIVTWVFSKSHEPSVLDGELYKKTDVFYANGGFFAAVTTRDQEKVFADSPTLTFYPVNVRTQNVFKDASITYGENLIANIPLPLGYATLTGTTSTTPRNVEIYFGSYIGSGSQDVVFKVANGVSLNDLRILVSSHDEDNRTLGWADVTVPNSLDPVNRTIRGKYNFVAGTGVFEGNSRLFIVARYNPALAKVEEASDVSVSGNSMPQTVRSGNNLTYNWTVSNHGPDLATQVGTRQQIDSGTTFVSATSSQGSCQLGGGDLHEEDGSNNIYCTIGDIPSGGTVNITVVVMVEPFGDGNGNENNIDISSKLYSSLTSIDPNLENNDFRVNAIAQPSLNKPPVVSITSPLEGTILISPSDNPTSVDIQITASDMDGTVNRIEVFDNGTSLGLATVAGTNTYSITLNAPGYGKHNVVAFAVDNGGRNAASSAISFWVNSSSTISITSPTDGFMVSSNGSLRIETRSNTLGARLRKVELLKNGDLLASLRQVSNSGNLYSHQYTWNSIPKGRYTLIAVLTEMSGATSTSSPVEVIVDSPPVISLTSPPDGTSVGLATSINFGLSVDDPDGYVTKIDYYANGSLINSTTASINSGTTEFKWQNPSEGVYSIVAVATDDLGVTSLSNPVNIGVNRPAPAIGEVVWVDDHVPAGATSGGDDGWNWMYTNPGSLMGVNAHQSLLKAGVHEHYFENASFKLQVNTGEKLSAWIFLDPDFPPAEIMLQWKDAQGWDHRAYWGKNLIDLGTDGTNSRRRIGDIPTGTGWKQLKVPANMVGLEGRLVNGMKFTLHGGRAAWDRVGKLLANAPEPPSSPDFVWIDDAPPPGALLEAWHDTWTDGTWINFNPSPQSGTLAHRHWDRDTNERYRQRSFRNAPQTMPVSPGDTLFAYIYLYPDAQYRPDSIVLQWYDDEKGWSHRAYWGIDGRYEITAPLPGSDTNTEGWRYMGAIPSLGGWTRLEIPASYVGLEGKNVKGMAFGIYKQNRNMRAVWDQAGRTSAGLTTTVPALKFTTPLYRFKCDTGQNERLYYTTNRDHNYFDFRGCASGVNTGYTYSYPAPGTIPLYRWEDPNNRWYLSLCDACHPGWTNYGVVAWLPNSGMPDVAQYRWFRCAQENWYFTSYPNPPETTIPGAGCGAPGGASGQVHTR